jgi:hypothetical protein
MKRLSFLLLLACITCSMQLTAKKTPVKANQNFTFTPQIYQYDGNKVTNAYSFVNSIATVNESTQWKFTVNKSAVKCNKGAHGYHLSFKLQKGNMSSCGTAVEFKFAKWNTDNYVFAPAALYNGNRYRVLPIGYPPYIYNEKDRPLNMPVTITNVPHLNLDGSKARLDFLTSNCSVPMIGFYDKHNKRGFLLATRQDTILGNSGFVFKEDPAQHEASIILAAPGVREKRYVMCRTIESKDKGIDLKQGDTVDMYFHVYSFHASDLSEFFNIFFSIRKDVIGKNGYINREPFSSIAATILDHHDKTKWFENDKYGYICNQPKENSPFNHIQLGWNGVPVFSLVQTYLPTAERTRRVCRSFDAIELMQGKSGLFYAMFRRGELLGDNFNDMSKKPEISMIRRTGLALYYGLQTIDLMKKHGESSLIKQSWIDMLRKASDALVKLWNTYGQFGQHVNAITGEITTNNSTNGAINIAALAYASKFFNDSTYMDIAKKSGDFYYNRDLKNGYSGGGPAEILQCPDSESSAELVESYVALYELTHEAKWLKMAKDAAALFSSWVVAYDYKFPRQSDMGRINAKATGAVWASVQNEHGAPGIYIMSGNFLFKLYRATGDKRYMELLKDIAHNVVQYVTTRDNPIGIGSAPGSVSERVNLSDWEGEKNIGMISAGDSNMAWENVAFLSITENPGIYIQPDKNVLFVLDHVKASIVANRGGVMTLQIENPTKRDADVALCIESSSKAKSSSLGWLANDSWPKVSVKSGEKVTIKVNSKGIMK